MFIYAITNDVNDKSYIGLHAGHRLADRWQNHLKQVRAGSRLAIHHAMRKYGIERFHIAAIWSGHIDSAVLALAERYFIKCFQSKSPKGYNLTDGGDGAPGLTDETLQRMRDRFKDIPLSQDHRDKLRQAKLRNPVRYWLGKKRPGAGKNLSERAASMSPEERSAQARKARAAVVNLSRPSNHGRERDSSGRYTRRPLDGTGR
jgi:group I intron endonuclease